jgi:hypothetical protein
MMANEITTGGELQPLSLQHMMTEALQVFRLCQDLEEAFSIAGEADELIEVVNRKFVALERAKTKEARFSVHCEAYDFNERLPPDQVVISAYQSVARALAAKPSEEERAQLVGEALDVWMINPDAAAEYGERLIYKLVECPKQPKERLFHRRKQWFAVPVIAGAFDHLLDTYRPTYGKPPSIPDVLEECGRQSDRLIDLHDQIVSLGRTKALLGKIIKATEDSYPDDDE